MGTCIRCAPLRALAAETTPDSDTGPPPDSPSERVHRRLLHHQRVDEWITGPPPGGTMTPEETRFGSGWISGVLSATLGTMGFGGVLCLLFPSLLTSPELRAIYPMSLVRGLIHFTLLSAFLLGVISVVLRPNKVLGSAG